MPNNPQRRLELVHLQITRRCNLHCWFCGQWGDKGNLAARTGSELSLEEWLAVVDSLEREVEIAPSIMLWGGEPTVSPWFAPLATEIHRRGFPLGMVTNGTQLDRFLPLCREAFDRIYISIDGTPKMHDAVRGDGVFAKVAANIHALRGGRAKITLMCVMTPETEACMSDVMETFSALEPDDVLLQERIALTPLEAKDYQTWIRNTFMQSTPGVDAWVEENQPAHRPHSWYTTWLAEHPQNFPVYHLPHGGETEHAFCLSPWRHLHVAWNGEVGFCTDFTDFSCGNVRNASLSELFQNDLAVRFSEEIRKGNCAFCNHCSWRNSVDFRLDSAR